jgi:outer membrane protein assembly factor BamD (BamD/ComL family)
VIARYKSPLASLLVLVMASGSVAQTLPAAKPAGSAAPASSAKPTPAPASTAGATGKSVPTGASSATPTSPTTPVGSALPPVPSTAPAPSSSAGTASADAATAGAAPTLTPPSAASTTSKLGPRRMAQTLPPPTPQQLSSLAALNTELGEYQAAAKDYRSTLTMIVRHHYDEKRRRVLSALDHEIDVEQKGLADARDEAIRRLEKFVETYSGANANVEATPDAMYRLAALYEERARADFEGDLSKTLKPAIDLYRRIIREYPKYEEISGVYYFLGHAYTDSSRLPEGQQAWRALVCNNQYSVTDDPTDSDKIAVQPLPQNHDEKFWNDWYNRHPVPLDQVGTGKRRGKAASAPAPAAAAKAKGGKSNGLAKDNDELRYDSPYPDTCEPVPQHVEPGDDPKYIAEIWWQIGNYHFDQIDVAGGPYELNRAMSAYEHSMKYEKPPLYGVAMYKRAWTYFKQQRYKIAVQWFVNLLHYADDQEAKTGDPGADFRQEAYTYIAGSLTYVDFDGPSAELPNIPRNDVLDVETNPVLAEDKMRIAIDRVQDPALIPQDRKWTVEIYKALAQEFIEITQNRNAIAVLELTLKKFPMDRDAPKMQNKIAELYDQLARLAPDGSSVKAEYAGKALEARTKLAAYVGTTPWTDANRDDPEALAAAEELVKNGLQRAAADHTNFARTYFQRAKELTDEGEQRALIEKAVAEYRLAETGWGAYIEQDPTALDSYESRFWLADARYWVVVLQIALGRTPTPQEIQRAKDAAIDVRDSNEDDKYLQPAAYYLVSISEKVLEDKYRQFQASGGAAGIEKRDEVRFTGDGENRKIVIDPVPPEVIDAIKARDDYNARISVDRDPEKNGLLYAFQAADYYFVYGHFPEARARYQPLYDQYCGQNEWGYKAWEKLISMSNFEGNAAQSRKLAEAKSCAYNEDSKAAEEALRKPVIQGVAYLDAQTLYKQAEAMADGPERQKKWRQAAAAYKVALDAAPGRDEAPEAAMNGAYAYKQVGEYDKAIAMYELFIAQYGNENKLDALQHGDTKAQPPVAADPKKYEDRVKFLKMAYDALANARVLFFDYPKAAETFDTISRNTHFPQDQQRAAARQSLSLYASLGDTGGMTRARERFLALGASPKEKAEADFIVASADMKKWDEFSPDSGSNEAARKRAEASMKLYYDQNKNNDAAAQYVVQAAYNVAKSQRASKSGTVNEAWQNTMRAFDKYKAVAPKAKDGSNSAVGSAEAAMAAEGAFTLIDQDVHSSFDYDSGHHHYKGTAVEVIKNYQGDAVDAKKWYDKLQHVVDDYAAPEWAAAAIARQGSLYDSLRTGLYETRPPALIMFDKKTEQLLHQAENSDNPDLQEKADAARTNVTNAWRDKREQELNSADKIMIDRYGNSVMLARRYNVSNPAIVHAIQRLAFFTDVIGEAKLPQYAAGVKDLNYTPGMFLRIRPGLDTAPPDNGTTAPLPVLP